MKTCKYCHVERPFSQFSPKRDHKDGLSNMCKPCATAKTKAWYAENKARALANQAAWREANRTRWNAVMRAVGKRRHAAKLQRVPGWYDHARAQEVYDLAAEFREAGFAVDVDHIVPLQGEAVSGLHWHGNLRVCLATANRSKRAEISPFHGPLAVEHNVAIAYRPVCTNLHPSA
jgi:hypothetical protein